jgi:hypothetical protein
MITAMVSMPAYDKTSKQTGIFPHSSTATATPTAQKRAKVTAVLAIVTIKHELLKFPGNLMGSQSVAP